MLLPVMAAAERHSVAPVVAPSAPAFDVGALDGAAAWATVSGHPVAFIEQVWWRRGARERSDPGAVGRVAPGGEPLRHPAGLEARLASGASPAGELGAALEATRPLHRDTCGPLTNCLRPAPTFGALRGAPRLRRGAARRRVGSLELLLFSR